MQPIFNRAWGQGCMDVVFLKQFVLLTNGHMYIAIATQQCCSRSHHCLPTIHNQCIHTLTFPNCCAEGERRASWSQQQSAEDSCWPWTGDTEVGGRVGHHVGLMEPCYGVYWQTWYQISARIYVATRGSGVAKLGHTGARALATGGCAPPVQALLKIIGAECTIINRKLGLKVHKGFEIELRSIAICIFRITRSCVLPWSQCICVCRKYYSDLTLRVCRFIAKAWSKCSNSRRRYGLK